MGMTLARTLLLQASATLLAFGMALPALAQPPAPRGGPVDIERRIVMTDEGGSRLGLLVKDTTAGAPKGVTVSDVTAGSPAEKAGLRTGDVITAYDGENVRSLRQFTRLVRESAPGRAVPIAVQRDGKSQTLSVTPEADADGPGGPQERDTVWVDIERQMPLDLRVPRMPRGPRSGVVPGLPEAGPERQRPGRAWPDVPMRSAPRRLGLMVLPLSPQLRTFFAAPAGGVLVSDVEADSPAAQAGVKAGDVVVTINGLAVRDADDLVDGVREAGPDSTLSLGVVRDRKPVTLSVTPARSSGRVGRPAA